MRISIFMKGPYPQHKGALVTVGDRDEPEHDGMKRYCWIECEKCDELLAAANQHFKVWDNTTIETDKFMGELKPVVIRYELMNALQAFHLESMPFTAVFSVFDAENSPFATRLERRTLDVTAV